MDFYSDWARKATVLPIFIFFAWECQRVRCLYYLAAFLLIVLVTNVMKLAYHNPRPFWVDSDIQAFSCSSFYGAPSGHSTQGMGIPIVIWLDIIHCSGCKLQYKIIWFLVAVSYGFSIMWTRLFLGVHSIDQVFYGATLGIWCAYVM